MAIPRKYDLGNGWTVKDDGHSLGFEQRTGESLSRSIGARRPRVWAAVPATVAVLYSRDRRYFYLPDYADVWGCWLSVKEYPSEEACKADAPAGILGPSGYEITGPGDRKVYRASLSFAMWDVKSGERVEEPVGEMHKDALHLCRQAEREQEARVDEVIRPSGWTLAKLMEKLGPWVPVEEPPVVILTLD